MADLGQAPVLRVEGTIATITLMRPEVANRLEPEDLLTLREQIAEVNEQASVRVLRLTGSGRHFCSGFNVTRIGASAGGSGFEDLGNALEAARPLTLAVVNGGLYGGASDIALACDFRLGILATEMFVPASRLGLHFYRSGMERFVSRLGVDMAKRVLLWGEKLDAQALLRCGFFSALYPSAEELQQAADSLCTQLSQLAPLSVQPMKRHLNAMARHALDAERLADDIERARTSDDLREGSVALRERRPPVFQGR
jgi:enoyl-CoA hydratase